MANDDATRGKGTGTSTPGSGSRGGDDGRGCCEATREGDDGRGCCEATREGDDGRGCCEATRDGDDGRRPPLLVAARAVAVLAGGAVVGGTAAPVDALAVVPWVVLAVGVAEVVRWRRRAVVDG
jgi:hypothetical protein